MRSMSVARIMSASVPMARLRKSSSRQPRNPISTPTLRAAKSSASAPLARTAIPTCPISMGRITCGLSRKSFRAAASLRPSLKKFWAGIWSGCWAKSGERLRGEADCECSLRPGKVDIERLHGGADASDNFAGPECRAQQGHPAVFRLTDCAENVAFVGGLVGVYTALGEVAFECRIRIFCSGSCAKPKRFPFEALEKLEQLTLAGFGHYHATSAGFAKLNLSRFAKLQNAIDVAEKIHHKVFFEGQGREDGRPNLRRLLAANRFAVFRFNEFEPNGFHARAEVQRFHVQRKGGQFERARRRAGGETHSSVSVSGNLARKSGDCLRTSSQSKNASGVSSQMRNQLAISTFSSRLCGSTL